MKERKKTDQFDFNGNVKAIRNKIEYLSKIVTAKNLGYQAEDIETIAVYNTHKIIILLDKVIGYLED